jgi:hypothetical protein
MAVSAPRVEACNQAEHQDSKLSSTLLIERADGGSVFGVKVRVRCPRTNWWGGTERADPYSEGGDEEQFFLPVAAREGETAIHLQITRPLCSDVFFEPDAPTTIVAELDGWWGYVVFGRTAPSRLAMQPNEILNVRVLDELGDGVAHAPVRLVTARELAKAKGRVGLRTGDGTCALSRGDGVASFVGVEFLRWNEFDGGEVFVQVDAFPLAFSPRALVSRERNRSPVVLNVSRLSTLQLEAVDESGMKLSAVSAFALASAPGAVADAREFDGAVALEARFANYGDPNATIETCRGGGGVASVPWVARDARLIALARRNELSDWSGEILESGREDGAGPIQVVPGAGCEALLLQVTRDGAPVGNSRLRFRRALRIEPWVSVSDSYVPPLAALLDVGPHDAEPRVVAVWSDWEAFPDGPLRIDFEPQARLAAGLIQVELAAGSGPSSLGLVDLRALPARAEHEVQLDFALSPGWITGVVENHMSQGVPEAWVSVETHELSGARGGDSHVAFKTFVFSDRHGKFRVQVPPRGTHRVRASCYGVGEASAESVAPGASLRLGLRGRSDMRGRVRAARVLDSANIRIQLLREHDNDKAIGRSPRSTRCSLDGEFEFPDVVHGRYTLIVRRVIEGAPPQELARIERLDVNVHGVFDVGEVLVSD